MTSRSCFLSNAVFPPVAAAEGVADRRQSVRRADSSSRPGVPLQRLQERFHGEFLLRLVSETRSTLLNVRLIFVLVPQFFEKRGVAEALGVYDLFNAVTGLNISAGAENEAEFLAEVTNTQQKDDVMRPRRLLTAVFLSSRQIVALEKRNEDHVQKRGKKMFSAAPEDAGPPLEPDD